MLTKVRVILRSGNAWKMHIITLALLVIFIGGGSQVLASAAAASIKPSDLKPIKIMAKGKIDDGDPVIISTCIFFANQRHVLTKLVELNGDGSVLIRRCD
ncbi:MAG TPA: hypothetical protein VFB60_05630 [Ktedonobacteraceae bacterium]|nr:hypothetical protein [Ktedonobacteraceae bacterium]